MEPRPILAPFGRFLRGLLGWALFAAPIVYFGMTAAVFLHEVLGHGLTSVLTGGEFHGFELDYEGGGFARTDSPDAAARAWVLAGGVLWEAATGVLLLLLATRVRPLHWRVFLLVVAANFLHDALPYAFWDALWLGGRGDASRLLALLDRAGLRSVLIAASGLALVCATFVSSRLVFRAMEEALGPFDGRRATLVTLLMTVFVALGYALAGFDLVVPGVGQRPAVLATALQAGVSVVLVRARRSEVEVSAAARGTWVAALLAAWSLCAMTVFALVRWFVPGVEFVG